MKPKQWIHLIAAPILLAAVGCAWTDDVQVVTSENPPTQLPRTETATSPAISSPTLAYTSTATNTPLPSMTPTGARMRLGNGSIQNLDLSDDGTQLLVFGPVGLFLYDEQTLEMIWSIPTRAGVISAAFSPDGKTIASVLQGGYVDLWNTPDGSHMWTAIPGQRGVIPTWGGYDDYVGKMIGFSPDGKWIAAFIAAEYELVLLNSSTGEMTSRLTDNNDVIRICALAFSPDGKTLAGATYSQGIHFWDIPSGKHRSSGIDQTISTRSIAYSPDGNTLAYNLASSIAFLDLAGNEVRMTGSEHDHYITDIAYSPDGRSIASSSLDHSIKIWNPANGSLLRTLAGHTDVVSGIAYGPEGTRLISGSMDGSLAVWNAANGNRLETVQDFQNPSISMSFSPDGGKLVAGSRDGKVTLWDTRLGRVEYIVQGHTDFIRSVDFSPDGKSFATGSKDTAVILWNAETGQKRITIKRGEGQVFSLQYSPDGRRLATGYEKNALNLLDPVSGGLITFTRFGHRNDSPRVRALAYSDDGTRIMVLLEDNYDKISVVEAVDPTSWKLVKIIKNNNFHSHAIAFSKDGKYFVICTMNKVGLWDLESESLNKAFSEMECGYNTITAISPDGQIAVSNRGAHSGLPEEIFLWDTSTGDLLRSIKGHNSGINVFTFSPDGKTLASASEDGSIILWKIED
jgi:WD40 repeat protein